MMLKFRQGSVRLIAAAFLAAATVLTAPNPAAAWSCSGASCRGKDPQTWGCNRDARTLSSIARYGTLVELRYSRRCNAVWSRVTNLDLPSTPLLTAYLGAGKVSRRTGERNVIWSLMWTRGLPACGGEILLGGPDNVFCTSAS